MPRSAAWWWQRCSTGPTWSPWWREGENLNLLTTRLPLKKHNISNQTRENLDIQLCRWWFLTMPLKRWFLSSPARPQFLEWGWNGTRCQIFHGSVKTIICRNVACIDNLPHLQDCDCDEEPDPRVLLPQLPHQALLSWNEGQPFGPLWGKTKKSLLSLCEVKLKNPLGLCEVKLRNS